MLSLALAWYLEMKRKIEIDASREKLKQRDGGYMSKLIAETGKCKLKAFAFPVRIHATDVGIDGDLICGDYKDLNGRMVIAWDKNGKYINNDESYDLVPIPQSQYFNIYTDADGTVISISQARDTLKSALINRPSKNATTCKYTDGLIEKVDESQDMCEAPEPPLVIGITASQYRADLDKLWTALNGNKNGVDDVFTMCANRIKKLEDALRPFAVFACSEKNSCFCNNCVARDLLDT